MSLKGKWARAKAQPVLVVREQTVITQYVDRAEMDSRREQEEQSHANKDAQLDLVAAIVERDDPPAPDEPPRLHEPITVGEKLYDKPMVSFVVDGKPLALVGVYDATGKINDVNVVDPMNSCFLEVPGSLYANRSSVRSHFARCSSRLADNDTIVGRLTRGPEEHAIARGTELAKPIDEESAVFHDGLVKLVQGTKMLGLNDFYVELAEMCVALPRHGRGEQAPTPL